MPIPRRFIAGAICPQCKEQDVIYVFEQDDKKHQACVECGFSKCLDETAGPTQTTGEISIEQASPVQVINIMKEPGKDV